MKKFWFVLWILLGAVPVYADTPDVPTDVAALGRMLYFDANLSRNRTQSCATCHAPESGFVDKRGTGVLAAASLGDDGQSVGDRNAPTTSYTRFSPAFHKTPEGKYVGGQFWDGRRPDLAGQAGDPILNPIEMAMPDKHSVIDRLKENPVYVDAFRRFYGDTVWDDAEIAYAAMARSIAAFEETEFFAPFDSKYDRYLRGEYEMTSRENLGMTLFFSRQFTNCNLCHQLRQSQVDAQEIFSNYQYHNIGVPPNDALRAINGKGREFVDRGLLDNPAVQEAGEAGRFKVPTLRNIAVTGPYMHNGVFKDLRTVILFYNKYNSRSPRRQINPETGKDWGVPEVSENISLKELETGPALDDKRVDALVAFLTTLTDKRYESLLETDSPSRH